MLRLAGNSHKLHVPFVIILLKEKTEIIEESLFMPLR